VVLSADSVLDCIEAAATGYLHVRVQDDLMDEGVGEAGPAMLLAEALFLRHQTLLARLVPLGSGFWSRFQTRWLAYNEAMLLEQHLHRSGGVTDAASFDQVLQRSWPLSLPAAAVLALAAVPDGAELDKALHLFTKGGRDGGERDARELRRRLMLGGGVDEVVAEIHQDLDRAVEAARVLDSEEACRFVEARRAFMADVQRKAFEGLFERLLGLPKIDVNSAQGGA
jgi:hypothetical protein